ncbi:hypothetical protein Q9L58_010415 [Maublancomyces gigas]|uniref:Uncharacterized protein n=1 Tax=Discina gigas TaxID=1032678 RepID=A0ABR3G477_9PEZI
MESLVSGMVSLSEVQNKQASTFTGFTKIIAEVHNFKLQCSLHIVFIMKEMNAYQATITSLTERIAALETATPPTPPRTAQNSTAGSSDQLLALEARINALETAPTPTPTPPPPPPPSPSPSYAAIDSKAPGPPEVHKKKCGQTGERRDHQAPKATVGQLRSNPSYNPHQQRDTGLDQQRAHDNRHPIHLGPPVPQRQPGPPDCPRQHGLSIDHGATIATCLKDLACTPTLLTPNAVWTSFLVHNIPTSFTPDEVATVIQLHYPTLPHLSWHPPWLTIAEKQNEKTHSTMVIT